MKHEVSMPLELYKQIIGACAKSVAIDNARPNLQYIRLVFTKGHVVAESLNGYQLAKLLCEFKSDEEFTCYIKPIAYKSRYKTCGGQVTITTDEGMTTIEMPMEEGTVSYTFRNPEPWHIDTDKIIGDSESRPHKIGIDANLLAAACKSMATIGRGYAILSVPDEPTAPLTLSIEGDGVELTTLVLPVRIIK